MRKLYFLILITLSSHSLFAQTIRYVKLVATGTEDGSSWGNASGNLQAMINASAAGDQVWVAAGTYKPTQKIAATDDLTVATTDRDMAFILRTGVRVYGGLQGNEPESFDLANRDFVANQTILSGDLGEVGDKSDNAYHVVTARISSTDLSKKARLDGFIIEKGYADGSGTVTAGLALSRSEGGAINTRGSDPTAAVEYHNLIIRNNESTGDGGAVRLTTTSATGVVAKLIFSNIQFIDNISALAGGAVYISRTSNTPSVEFIDCLFLRNKANDGAGGAINAGLGGSAGGLIVANSRFYSNTANSTGGAIYITGVNSTTSLAYCNIVNNLFYDNLSKVSGTGGGALYLASNTINTVINNTFYKNTSVGNYGAIGFNNGTSTTLNLYNNVFNENSTDIRNATGTTGAYQSLRNNLFQNNYSTGDNRTSVNNISNASPASLFVSTNSTEADFLKLTATSVVLDAGDNALSTALVDFASLPRIRNNTIDLGAYEFQIGNYPLPVKLETYIAVKQGTTAVLTWKTASEQNNQKFVIERGSSAGNFTFFKEVAGAGDSNALLSYSVTDFAPLAGTNYYKLTQYDNDGKSEVLGVQAVSFDLTSSKTKVYPNPAKSYIEVKPSSSNAIISLNLISLTGENILTNNYAQTVSSESVKLDLTNVPIGTYVLWINKGKSNSEKQTLLVVK